MSRAFSLFQLRLIWPLGVKECEGISHLQVRALSVRVGERTGWGTRRAERRATMDHTDIRGLATALHRSVAGLPRSRVGDHQVDAHIVEPRVPLTVSAHRVADPV